MILEFAWNTQKNGMGAVKGLEKEQEREGKTSNKEIVPEKTHLNYDLVQSDLNLYQRIKQRVDEVRPVSRVQKNSVVDYSNIITVPQEQFKEWGVDKSKEYLKSVYEYFCQEFGKKNVVSAKVHLDETTPHMHLHFVPVSEQGKLQARKIMTPQRINKIHTEAPKYLQEMGFDVIRGQGKTDKSLEINEYKAEKLQDRISELENKLAETTEKHKSTIEQLKQAQAKVKDQFESVKKTSDSLSKLSEHTKGIIGRLDSIKAEKAKIPFLKGLVISEENYGTLRSIAKLGESKALENLQLKAKIGELENKLNAALHKKSLDAELKDIELQKLKGIDIKYRNLKKTFDRVEKALNNLDLVDKVNDEIKIVKQTEKSMKKSFEMEI